MPELDRRKLLHAGVALAIPLSGLPLLAGCQQPAEPVADGDSPGDKPAGNPADKNPAQENKEPESEGNKMQLQYLEIVTPDVDALCKQYTDIHGISFSEPEPNLGNARLAKLEGGGSLSIRGPLRDTETPVIRPYMLVDDLEKAVAAAEAAGAEVAIPSMEIPGHGTIAIVIQGGIECGLWKA